MANRWFDTGIMTFHFGEERRQDPRISNSRKKQDHADNIYYGIIPLLYGSLIVTLGAALIAIPLGIGSAIYISEIAPRWLREILKPFIEILGGLPSVVLGFVGIMILSPYLRVLFRLPTGLAAFTGSILGLPLDLQDVLAISMKDSYTWLGRFNMSLLFQWIIILIVVLAVVIARINWMFTTPRIGLVNAFEDILQILLTHRNLKE